MQESGQCVSSVFYILEESVTVNLRAHMISIIPQSFNIILFL